MSEDDNQALDSELFRSRYRVIRSIGKGSFGEAILVRSKLDGKRYVAKTVDSGSMSDKEKRDVQNEIRILAAVNHPNIIRYHEHFLDGTFIFIIMEYADGGDLSSRIKEAKSQEKPKPFEPQLAMFWFLQICMALKYLHDNHVLHRDLKTANIFLTSKNVVKLGDFGISTVLQTSMACAKTVCGTPYYFSPELCQSKPYNNKSDVWALGVVFYESLTLQRPFNARSLKELLKKIKVGQFDPLPETIPAEIRRLCCSLLQVNPTQRPNVNRILESSYVQDCLKNFSADLERQAEKDRAEYEAKHGGAPPPKESAPRRPAEPVPVEAPKAPKQPSEREQMAALRGMSKDQMKQMLAKQSSAAASPAEAQKNLGRRPTESSPEVDDDGEYIAQKKYIAQQTRDLVGKKNIGSHPEEFGDANPESSMTASFGGEHMVLPNGKSYNAVDGRKCLEKELGPELLQKAVELYNNGTMAGMSNNELQRELNELVGAKYAQYCNAVGQLALLEGKF